MRNALKAFLFAAFLMLPSVAFGQCSFPTPVPANVVIGRLGIGAGPCQAIPFSVLSSNLTAAIITLNSGNGQTAPGAMSGGNTYSFGANTDTPRFAGIGLGGAAPATGLEVYNAPVSGTGNGQGIFGATSTNGGVFAGQGSLYDAALANKSGAVALGVSTGTQNIVLQGTLTAASLTTSGTIGGSLCATAAGVILYEAAVNCFTVSGISVTAGKTLTVTNTITLSGTDGTTFTFPSSSDTVDTLAANQTISGNKTFSGTLNITGTGQLNGTVFGTFATQNFATPPAIGATTPNTGAFSTLTATTPIGLSSGGTNASTAAGARASGGLDIDQLTSHGDSNYTVLATDRVVGTSSTFTAARTWTLPGASTVNAGQRLIIADFVGGVSSTNTLTIARAGSDTVNGSTSVVINASNGAYELISDGVSKWTAQALGVSATVGVSSVNGATGGVTIVAGTGISINVAGANITAAIAPIISNSLTSFTVQDLASSQDSGTLGTSSSSSCDPGIVGGSGNGPCTRLNLSPNTTGSWNTLLLQGTNSRVVIAANGGVADPEFVCSDTNTFGVPGWLGTSQAGCGVQTDGRTGSGAPAFFNMSNLGASQSTLTASSATSSGGRSTLTVTAQSGSSLVLGETIVGTSIPASTTIVGNAATNPTFCSPNCTGAGGTGTYSIGTVTGTVGSELMIGGPSGAEGSIQVQIQGGSLDGQTQNILAFINTTGCSSWVPSSCTQTTAGLRLGEVAGFGITADGLQDQTECWSMNGYAALTWTGTHLDTHYTAPTNLVFRLCPNSSNPERNTLVFDYNANILVGTGWSTTSAQGSTIGAIYLTSSGSTSVPGNPGDLNIFYARGTQQGESIRPSADSGSSAAINFENAAGSQVGSITTTSSATAYNVSSDRRLKTNVVPTREIEVGRLIDQLQVVDFKFKADPGVNYIGFIAQDEYKVFPAAVSPGDDTDAMPGDPGFYAWQRDDSKLVPLLVREVQSLRQRVKHLETRH